MSAEFEKFQTGLNGASEPHQHVKSLDDERPAQPPHDVQCPVPVVEQQQQQQHESLPNSVESSPVNRNKLTASQPSSPMSQTSSTSSQRRSPFDTRLMSGFYDACVSKFLEQETKWQEQTWRCDGAETPFEMSQKNRVYDLMRTYMKQNNEQCVLMQNFDYADLQAFESFLQSLKYDGLNSISKYKQYLESRDLNKTSLDLVILHAKYGIILVETKESDYLDNRRRMKVKSQLTQIRLCFENLLKMLNDAKGLHGQETIKLPVFEVVALPNVVERPKHQERHTVTPATGAASHKKSHKSEKAEQKPVTEATPASVESATTAAAGTPSSSASYKQLNYLIKSDLEDFGKWWKETIADKYVETQAQQDKKTRTNVYTSVLSLINTVRKNLVIPVINEEIDTRVPHISKAAATVPAVEASEQSEKKTEERKMRYNVCAEFFHERHEKLRTWSKACLASNDKDKLRRSVCLQILWTLLNDTQKKLSVVITNVQEKQYYEEYFHKQRRLYNTSLNNVRFYTNMECCADTSDAHTLRKDNDMWLFVTESSMLNEVFERVKDLKSYWVFAGDANRDVLREYVEKSSGQIKYADMDESSELERTLMDKKPWLSDLKLKFPLRLTSDLLVVGDIVAPNQTKLLNDFLKDSLQSKYYQPISKKLRTVKYLRGGSIENLRQTLKMHDQIQSKIVLLHVGDEDLFRTRNAQSTIEHIKELTQLIKEYCPKSFVVLSTLMRRMSKSENQIANDVNKGIISYCKQSKDLQSYHYMLNNHFNPDYHTYEGRVLSNKGLRLYVDNILFVVDYFYVKKNKQN